MLVRSVPLTLVGIFLVRAATAEAQSHFTLDLEVWGLGVAWTRGVDGSRTIGVGAGVGGSVVHWTAISGDHFSDVEDVGLDEILHLAVFSRAQVGSSWTADVGLRGSLLLHGDSGGGGNLGVALFGGPYASLLWGSRLMIGPRLHVGFASEGGADSRGWALRFMPLTGRLVL